MNAAPPLDVRTWGFWRKRLGRVLVVGALALLVTQLVPNLPKDQVVQFVAHEGTGATRLRVSYGLPGDREILGATELYVTSPEPQLTHVFRLPDGDYEFRLEAQVVGPDSAQDTVSETHLVSLTGSTARVQLRGP